MQVENSYINKPVMSLGVIVADLVANPVSIVPDRAGMIVVDDMQLFPGGGALNTSTTLARLGVPVSIVGRVGEDSLGDFLMDALNKEEINTHWIQRDPKNHTSATMVMVDEDGERRFIHYIGSNGSLQPNDINREVIENASVLHIAYAFILPGLDGEAMADILRNAKDAGVVTVLDTAWDTKDRWLDLVGPVLPHVDYFVPNLAEARALTALKEPEEIAYRLLDFGVQTVIIKMNKAGCLAVDRSGRKWECPAFPVNVVDTTGAGDAFVAGLIAGIWYGKTLGDCLQLANAVGALCVSGAGAIGNVSTLMETQLFMSEHQVKTAIDFETMYENPLKEEGND